MASHAPVRWSMRASRGAIQLFLFLLVAFAFCSLAQRFGLTVAVLATGFVCGLIRLPIRVYSALIRPLIRGNSCPTCQEKSLVRVAAVSFGYRYCECIRCGQRCKSRRV